MQVPLEITFHNMESSDWAEQEIRARVDDLESIYDRLTSCRVRVDQRATNSNDTIPPVVRIEIGIPGRKDLVVAHEPDRLQLKFQRPDLHNAINEAFRIAERQLSEYKDRLKDHTKELRHEAGQQRAIHHRVDRALERRVGLQVPDVVQTAGREVVDDEDTVSQREQAFGEMTANEAGAASDQIGPGHLDARRAAYPAV